jgi:hypothetical protein
MTVTNLKSSVSEVANQGPGSADEIAFLALGSKRSPDERSDIRGIVLTTLMRAECAPAMVLSITDRAWKIGDLIEAARWQCSPLRRSRARQSS